MIVPTGPRQSECRRTAAAPARPLVHAPPSAGQTHCSLLVLLATRHRAATSRKSKKKGAARSETAEPYEGPSEIHEEPPAPARTDKKGRGKKQRAQVAAAAAEDAGNSSASPRKGRLKRTGTVAVRGTKALRNPRQALQLFHSSDFNVDDFIGSVYQVSTLKCWPQHPA